MSTTGWIVVGLLVAVQLCIIIELSNKQDHPSEARRPPPLPGKSRAELKEDAIDLTPRAITKAKRTSKIDARIRKR